MSASIPSDRSESPDSIAGGAELARRDLLYACAVAGIALVVALSFDIGDSLVEWTRVSEVYEMDELLIGSFVLCMTLMWYCGRRWRQALAENAVRARLERTLARNLEQTSALLEDNRRLLARLSNLQEEERIRLARELHDAFGQHLTAISANASAALALSDSGVTVPADLPRRIVASTEFLSTCTRSMLTQLRPPSISTAGLAQAVRDLVDEWIRTTPRTRFMLDMDGNFDALPEDVSIAVYRILQESLLNCVRHAAADEVRVALRLRDLPDTEATDIEVTVDDNGVGFGHVEPGRGLGVIGMRERARALHGQVEIVRRQPQGTRMACVIPLPFSPAGPARLL